ncbi:stress response serine/threonine protein kinase YihE [Gammaproteobacteria bacterium 45_16_T64]|nr:stress response serine/threonine protein kinase YihE [Gammaproteobacteria bacterium 45_16_T64]
MLETDYDNLTPDIVIQAIESIGYLSDARVFALNSYENRVYQVGIDEKSPVIAKFYRPLRWTDAQIIEEHNFTQLLADIDLPVIPPLRDENGHTLHQYAGYRFSLFARQGGQAPEPDDFDQIYRLGMLLGRIHKAGSAEAFQHRPNISIDSYGIQPASLLLENGFVPNSLSKQFERVIEQICTKCEAAFQHTSGLTLIRSHGDCHIGNILWNRDTGPWFVDFDDCRTAPAIQDLWMLLSGERANQSQQISEILEGYREFHEFNLAELQLIEPLRSLRIIHYAGWLAKRWSDPAFPLNFPWFNTDNYWQQFLGELEDQHNALDLPPLTVY